MKGKGGGILETSLEAGLGVCFVGVYEVKRGVLRAKGLPGLLLRLLLNVPGGTRLTGQEASDPPVSDSSPKTIVIVMSSYSRAEVRSKTHTKWSTTCKNKELSHN